MMESMRREISELRAVAGGGAAAASDRRRSRDSGSDDYYDDDVYGPRKPSRDGSVYSEL